MRRGARAVARQLALAARWGGTPRGWAALREAQATLAWLPYAAEHSLMEAAFAERWRELASAPPVEAVVVAVADTFVVLAQEEGCPLLPGMELTVYRGERFVARVRVEERIEERVGCWLLFSAEGETPRPGDLATNRLE